jgi:hypothetical protein
MIMWGGKRLLAVFESAHEGQNFFAKPLVLLQHLVQVIFEMPYLALGGMYALVPCLHHPYHLGKIILCGRGVLRRCVGG